MQKSYKLLSIGWPLLGFAVWIKTGKFDLDYLIMGLLFGILMRLEEVLPRAQDSETDFTIGFREKDY